MSESWLRAFPLDRLPPGGSRILRHGREQVAVFHLPGGALHAVDNRCPHEGYPLAQGPVKGCVLTCPWHNYKFDLRDGNCLLGEEAVRTFPVRVVDGQVEVALRPEDPQRVRARLAQSLGQALARGEVGRIARDVARWLDAGLPADALALQVALHDARHAEYGTSHVLPVARDALDLGAPRPDEDPEAALRRATYALMTAFGLAAESHVRRPVRAPSPPIDPGDDPAAAEARLRALVEDEDAAAAEGLVRGAIERGWGAEVLQPWVLGLCADHFLDFGHQAIYTVKLFELVARVGEDHLDPLVPSLVWGIAHGTREDLLPAWAAWRGRLQGLDLAALEATPRREVTLQPVREALLEATPGQALDAVIAALAEGAGPEAVIAAISSAAHERLLRFDPSLDASLEVQESWLGVTHRVTFPNAVRHALPRLPSPRRLRLVLQASRFVSSGRPLDLPPERRPTVAPRAASPDDVLSAIAAGAPDDALSAAAGCLQAGGLEALRRAIVDLVVQAPKARPIVNAHLVKNTVVAFEDAAHLGEPTPVLALVRLLASPVSERFQARRTHEALELVLHGRTPRTLA